MRSFYIKFSFKDRSVFILSKVASNDFGSIYLVDIVHLHDVVLHGGAEGYHVLVHVPEYEH